MPTSRVIHRSIAALLGLFIVSHLIVHLFALAGPEAHLATLDAVQWIYRNPVVETLLVLAILTQIVTGARRVRFANLRGWALAQVASGSYLIVFLVVHTSAALYTHHIFGLETDFYWAAGSLHFEPMRYGFALYYSAAIVAFFTHAAAAIHFGWPQAPRAIARALPVMGVLVAGAIIAAFWGALYPIEVGPGVEAYYEKYFGPFGVGGG